MAQFKPSSGLEEKREKQINSDGEPARTAWHSLNKPGSYTSNQTYSIPDTNKYILYAYRK